MEIKFKDYLGIFFLGGDYEEKIWEKMPFDSYSLKIFSYEEKLASSIFTVVRRNLQQKIKDEIRENNLDVSFGDLKCVIDIATFSTIEDKENKIIETAYIISYSTGLKPVSAIKLQYIKNVSKLSGWKINNAIITYINKDYRGEFQDNDFVFSEYFSIANDKKEELGKRNIKISSYLNDEKMWGVIIPNDNRGNSRDYLHRSMIQWRNADEKMLDVIQKYQSNHDEIENLSYSMYRVRVTDGERWLLNKDLISAFESPKAIVISSENYEVIPQSKTGYDEWDFSAKKVFFDFETISLPFSAFEGMVPYQQIPVQYSVIKTNESNEIVFTKNRIYNFSAQEDMWTYFKEMIDDIFWDGAKYICHNKVFENRCIQEMLKAFSNMNLPDFSTIDEKAFSILLDSNSIDTNVIVANHFKFEDFPSKSSIKYLNAWFEKFRKFDFHKYGVNNYSEDLKISNGLYAQNELTKLYFGLIPNNEVQLIENNLKDYCENDVRGMIMLVDFIIEEFDKI